MRLSGSYIYKESNVYDRNIQEYATGPDGFLESDRIKQKIFETEHDLWGISGVIALILQTHQLAVLLCFRLPPLSTHQKKLFLVF